MLKIKVQCPDPGRQRRSSLADEPPVPGAEAMPCVRHVPGCFLRPRGDTSLACLMSPVLTGHEPVLEALLLRSSFSVTWEAASGLVLHLAQMKLFPILLVH